MRIVLSIFYCLLFVSGIAAIGYSLTEEKLLEKLLINTSYYLVFALFFFWAYQLYNYSRAKFDFRSFFHRYYPGLIGAFVLAVLVFVSVSTGYKVLSDETNLIAISKAMMFKNTIVNETMGRWYYDNFYAIHDSTPKRPFLFPFVLQLVHLVSGYRPENAFVLNFFVFFGLLFLAYVVFRYFFDPLAGFAAMILIVAQPIVTICATSAGFEVFSIFLFCLSFVALYRFLRSPNADRFLMVWMFFLLLNHSRYECFLYFTLVVAGLFLLRKIKWEYIKAHGFYYSLTPFFVMPVVWQRFLKSDAEENSKDVAAFGLEHLTKHAGEFLKNQINFEYFLPYATVVNLVGWAFLLALIVGLAIRKLKFRKSYQMIFAGFLALSVGGTLLLYLSYWFGLYTHPASMRYFIAVVLVGSLIPFAFKGLGGPIKSRVLLAYSIAALVYYHPVAIEQRATDTLTLIRKTRIINDFLTKLDNKNILLISDRPGQYTIRNFGAVNFNYAKRNASTLLTGLRRRLYTDLLVAQNMSYETKKPESGYEIDPSFQLQTLHEAQFRANSYIRISRVLGRKEKRQKSTTRQITRER